MANLDRVVGSELSERCWLWQGAFNSGGYGMVWTGSKMELVHRIIYKDTFGKIGDGMTLDHLCRVRRCVNPNHLEPTTPRENVLRGEGPAARAARSETCKHGHRHTTENTRYRADGRGRVCLPCQKEYDSHRTTRTLRQRRTV